MHMMIDLISPARFDMVLWRGFQFHEGEMWTADRRMNHLIISSAAVNRVC